MLAALVVNRSQDVYDYRVKVRGVGGAMHGHDGENGVSGGGGDQQRRKEEEGGGDRVNGE